MEHHSPPPFLADVLRAHGRHSLAYAAMQPGMRYFGDPDRGVIAYRAWLGQATVLGDPIAPSSAKATLIDDFLARHPRALFMQTTESTSDRLRARGFAITPVGVENEIAVAHFSLRGKRKADLRHYRNRAVAGSVTVREETDTTELRQALKPVSDAWLPSKSWFTHELEFLARPFVATPEPGVRIFTGRIGSQIVAFVILDPMYDNDFVTGYTVTILRHTPDAPEGAVDYINLHVIATLRNEGVETLSLGVSPFHRIESLAESYGRGAWTAYLLFLALRRWGSPIYHFSGLSFHKSRYRAKEIPVFAAVAGPLSLLPLYASARACRML